MFFTCKYVIHFNIYADAKYLATLFRFKFIDMILRPRLRSRLGCKTCLKRRKKCDEIKPVCGTCRRLNIRCFWTSEEQAKTKVASVKHLAFTLGLKQVSRAPVLHKGLDLSPFRDQICAAYALGTIFNVRSPPET